MRSKTPFFSVIIPAYNCERFLSEAIESVLSQTFGDFEIVVCDNASTDGTGEVIRSYEGAVRYVRREQNSGPAGGRNAAIAVARGRYLAFLDADDLWTHDKLERCYEVIRCDKAEFVFSSRVNIDAEGRMGSQSISPRGNKRVIQPKDPLLLLMNFIPCSSVVLRGELVKERPFNEDITLWTLEDHLLWMEINQKTLLHYIPLPLLKYRLHEANAAPSHRDNTRLQRHLDGVEELGLYSSDTIEIARRVFRLKVSLNGGSRKESLVCLASILWGARGPQRRLVADWILFNLRHLRTGAARKWVSWPFTGRPRYSMRPTAS